MKIETDYNIYAKHLSTLKKGYPLWLPEPNDNDGEILIGDVGWIEQGSFNRLFNALRDRDDPVNIRGVPVDFEPLQANMERLRQVIPGYIPPQMLFNTKTTKVEVKGNINA